MFFLNLKADWHLQPLLSNKEVNSTSLCDTAIPNQMQISVTYIYINTLKL